MTASTAAGYGFRLMSASKNNARPAKPVRLWPLLALNFFMSDMQSGIGPFVGGVPANAWLGQRLDRNRHDAWEYGGHADHDADRRLH
jgi:hypothetical protein